MNRTRHCLVFATLALLPRLAFAQAPDTLAAPDFAWVPGNAGPAVRLLAAGPFTGEFRMDDAFHYSFRRPKDDTITGSSEVFRHGEFGITQLGLGGDLAAGDVQGRFMTQFGLYSTTTPRNDASPARGQWRLDDAHRAIAEAYGGYHFHGLKGIDLQAGLFMSYIGLWSYSNADNWTYQPSYVSSNTPWFFNGMRARIFVNDHLKIEPWLVNGWQSYGRLGNGLGTGGQIQWRPNGRHAFVFNQYVGTDTYGLGKRMRVHTDDSWSVLWRHRPGSWCTRAAVSLTLDAGGENGAGVSNRSQYFLGFMAYQRLWFAHDHAAFTFGGGAIRNPGRYLVLLPPVNGATATSGTPYFTQAPGDRFDAWDMQTTADLMPTDAITFRTEYTHRAADVPYFAGAGGVTPPGGNIGAPGSLVPGWSPDLVKSEDRVTFAMLVHL